MLNSISSFASIPEKKGHLRLARSIFNKVYEVNEVGTEQCAREELSVFQHKKTSTLYVCRYFSTSPKPEFSKPFLSQLQKLRPSLQ